MARPAKLIPDLLWHSARSQYYIRVRRKMTYLGADFQEAQKQYLAIVHQITDTHVNPPIDPRGTSPIPSSEKKRSSVVKRVLSADDLTMSEALLEYIKHLKAENADPRKIHRVSTVFRLLAKKYGSSLVNDFRAKKLKAFRDDLMTTKSKRVRKEYTDEERGRDYSLPELADGDDGKGEKTLSRRYINHLVAALQLAFDWLASEELVHPETVEVLRTVKPLTASEKVRDAVRVVPVARETVDATLMECSPVVRAMILCQLYTGCRPGEICRIKRGDISTTADERILIPNTTLKVSAITEDGTPIWIYIPPQHKGSWRNKPRAILLGPRAQAEIRPFLDRKPDEFLFTTGRRNSKRRVPYTTHGLGQYISRVIFRVNKKRTTENVKRKEKNQPPLPMVAHWQPNQLRHHQATEVREVFGRHEAAEYLGHSGTDTIDTYAERAIQSAAKVAKELG